MKAEQANHTNIVCFKKIPGDLPKLLELSAENSSEKYEDERFILCRNCGSPLTSIKFKISVNGNHTHVFANPFGMIFEIACFSNAPGCGSVSRPSDEFSWFRGHTWMISVCKLCLNHNGWIFESKDHFFFGLISDQITDS